MTKQTIPNITHCNFWPKKSSTLRWTLKSRPNDCNMPTQHIATLLGATCCVRYLANATYRNIVGCNMLCAFGHRVAMYLHMLGVVGPNWTILKLERTTPNMSQHGGQTIATCCAQQCCDMNVVPRSTKNTDDDTEN